MAKRKKTEDLNVAIKQVIAGSGLKPEEWKIEVNFTKGMLTSTRGAVVEVESLKHGIKRKRSNIGLFLFLIPLTHSHDTIFT